MVQEGKRPDKPENASAIGFSDSLWSFTQRCWDGNMKLRPKVGEVMRRFREAAANWDGLMPPCAQAEGGGSDLQCELSDSMKYSEFWVLITSP